MDGYGVYIWPDGKKYEGEFKEDKKHGKGTYTYKDGRIFEGEYKDGRQHGTGKCIANGQVKVGIWVNGRREKWIDQ